MKNLEFLGSSLNDLRAMPAPVRHEIGVELMRIQFGAEPRDFKPMPSVGHGVYELRVRSSEGAFRAIYVAKLENSVYVLHAFQKKTRETRRADIEMARRRYQLLGG